MIIIDQFNGFLELVQGKSWKKVKTNKNYHVDQLG